MDKVLVIGCGPKKYGASKNVNVINIDKDPFNNPDVVRDVEKGLPFDDNSITEIYSEHFLEHLNPDNVNFFMFECWRVLKNGGLFKAIVPIGESWNSSPFHKTHFNRHTPLFFTEWNNLAHSGYEFKFIKKDVKTINPDVDWQDEMYFELEAVKKDKKKNERMDKQV